MRVRGLCSEMATIDAEEMTANEALKVVDHTRDFFVTAQEHLKNLTTFEFRNLRQ